MSSGVYSKTFLRGRMTIHLFLPEDHIIFSSTFNRNLKWSIICWISRVDWRDNFPGMTTLSFKLKCSVCWIMHGSVVESGLSTNEDWRVLSYCVVSECTLVMINIRRNNISEMEKYVLEQTLVKLFSRIFIFCNTITSVIVTVN